MLYGSLAKVSINSCLLKNLHIATFENAHCVNKSMLLHDENWKTRVIVQGTMDQDYLPHFKRTMISLANPATIWSRWCQTNYSEKMLTNSVVVCIIYLLWSWLRPTSLKLGAHHVLFWFLIKLRLRLWKPKGLCLSMSSWEAQHLTHSDMVRKAGVKDAPVNVLHYIYIYVRNCLT